MRRNYILIVCAALIATLPLFAYGCSCGHDFDFHLQSWLDAAAQFRQGTLMPQWAFSAAFNAGEPRFIFYPPLSWMLGALLTFIFPIGLVPAMYMFIVLAAAGFAMYRLAVYFVSPNAALVAATLYIANPYMLFTAFERTAYAELLAAAWLPLLFLAVLRRRPTVHGVALPIALLWLTNAPAAVMGCYALAVIVIARIIVGLASKSVESQPLRIAVTSILGTALGLTLPGFYLLPAAYERRFVQIAMAIIPNMRFQDNFLFGHTGDVPHDQVLHTASLLALAMLIAAFAVLAVLWSRRDRRSSLVSQADANGDSSAILYSLTILTLCVAFLLTPISASFWSHLPELGFLQFPWRLLLVLAVVLALIIALGLRQVHLNTAIAIPLSLLCVAGLTFATVHNFRQGCDTTDLPTVRMQLFKAHQGVEPTDEYTPTHADNDTLRANDPPFWLARNAAAYAPGTIPNPAATDPNAAFITGTTDARTAPVPLHFSVDAPSAGFLILNLRDYPNWDVVLADPNSMNTLHPPHISRDDGLIAVPLYNGGDYAVAITWHRTLDQQIGLALSIIAAGIYGTLMLRVRSRRIEV